MGVRRYQDLDCWRLSNELKLLVYEVTATHVPARDFRFCDQVRGSARSAPANIAEGFGRFGPKEFARFLDIARGSLTETINHLEDGRDLGYVDPQRTAELVALANRAIGATTRLLQYLRRVKPRT